MPIGFHGCHFTGAVGTWQQRIGLLPPQPAVQSKEQTGRGLLCTHTCLLSPQGRPLHPGITLSLSWKMLEWGELTTSCTSATVHFPSTLGQHWGKEPPSSLCLGKQPTGEKGAPLPGFSPPDHFPWNGSGLGYKCGECRCRYPGTREFWQQNLGRWAVESGAIWG